MKNLLQRRRTGAQIFLKGRPVVDEEPFPSGLMGTAGLLTFAFGALRAPSFLDWGTMC
jgi:hypothetical protein